MNLRHQYFLMSGRYSLVGEDQVFLTHLSVVLAIFQMTIIYLNNFIKLISQLIDLFLVNHWLQRMQLSNIDLILYIHGFTLCPDLLHLLGWYFLTYRPCNGIEHIVGRSGPALFFLDLLFLVCVLWNLLLLQQLVLPNLNQVVEPLVFGLSPNVVIEHIDDLVFVIEIVHILLKLLVQWIWEAEIRTVEILPFRI